MFIKSSDIACFLYCPFIKTHRKAKEVVLSTLTPFEEKMREAIKEAERICLFKNSEITSKKIIRAWDRIWWPYTVEKEIDFKLAKSLSLKACYKFSDYCKYDISDFMYATVGTDITCTKQIGSTTVESTIDVVKVNLSDKKRNTILIDLGRKDLSSRDIVLDADVQTKAYCFYQNKEENVMYINVDLNENNKKLHVNSAIFRQSNMNDIRKTITMAKIGIENNVKYMNRYNCKECNLCKNFKL